MKFKNVFFTIFSGMTLGLCAGELVSNPEFHEGLNGWNQYPRNCASYGKTPDGSGVVSVSAGGRLFQTFQKPVPGGIYNGTIHVRAGSGFKGGIFIIPECFDASGKQIVQSFQRGIIPGDKWREYPFAFILPEKTASFRLTVQISGKGNLEIDAIHLNSDGIFFGKHPFLSMTATKEEYEISSSGIGMKLAGPKQLFAISGMSAFGKETVKSVTLSLRTMDRKQLDEYYSRGEIERISMEEDALTTSLSLECAWQEVRYTKTITFFKDQPYVKIFYELEACENFQCSHATLIFITDSEMRLQMSKGSAFPSGIQWKKAEWFSIPRPDTERWIAWSDDQNAFGCAVIGADPLLWKEFPDRLLCAARKNGGFKLELSKWNNYPVRKGDKVSFEIFISILKGSAAEKASVVADSITGKRKQ